MKSWPRQNAEVGNALVLVAGSGGGMLVEMVVMERCSGSLLGSCMVMGPGG